MFRIRIALIAEIAAGGAGADRPWTGWPAAAGCWRRIRIAAGRPVISAVTRPAVIHRRRSEPHRAQDAAFIWVDDETHLAFAARDAGRDDLLSPMAERSDETIALSSEN